MPKKKKPKGNKVQSKIDKIDRRITKRARTASMNIGSRNVSTKNISDSLKRAHNNRKGT